MNGLRRYRCLSLSRASFLYMYVTYTYKVDLFDEGKHSYQHRSSLWSISQAALFFSWQPMPTPLQNRFTVRQLGSVRRRLAMQNGPHLQKGSIDKWVVINYGVVRQDAPSPASLQVPIAEDNTLVLSAEPNASWWIDASSEHLRVSSKLYPHTEWCICADQPQLYVCKCGAMHIKQRYLVVNRGLLQGYDGLKCLQADQTLNFERCPAGSREKRLRRQADCKGWHIM